MGDEMYLLDTPGLLWPRMENQMAALRLAASGAVKDEVVDAGELCAFLLTFIEDNYQGALEARYGIKAGEAEENAEEPDYVTESIIGNERLRRGLALLEMCGRSRGCLIKGGEVDLNRAAATVLDEFRAGKIGKISLDMAGVVEEEERILRENAGNEQEKERRKAARKAAYKSRRKK